MIYDKPFGLISNIDQLYSSANIKSIFVQQNKLDMSDVWYKESSRQNLLQFLHFCLGQIIKNCSIPKFAIIRMNMALDAMPQTKCSQRAYICPGIELMRSRSIRPTPYRDWVAARIGFSQTQKSCVPDATFLSKTRIFN